MLLLLFLCCFVAVVIVVLLLSLLVVLKFCPIFFEKKLTWPMSQVFSLLGHGCMMQSMQMLLWNFNSIQSYLGQKTKWLLVAFV